MGDRVCNFRFCRGPALTNTLFSIITITPLIFVSQVALSPPPLSKEVLPLFTREFSTLFRFQLSLLKPSQLRGMCAPFEPLLANIQA